MAAGLGFKDFTTGEVLTAADVDGYLMQGVWVFASAAARDAAVTSPQEGNFAYLKDTNVTTYYTGSAWANLDTTGMTNPMTTTGDTIYSSSGSTPARLGIGSTGQVLTVAGGVPSWATPSSGGGMTSLASGTLAAAATGVDLQTISQSYVHLQLVISDYTFASDSYLGFRFNGNSGSVYQTATWDFNNSNASDIYNLDTQTRAYANANNPADAAGTGYITILDIYNYASNAMHKQYSIKCTDKSANGTYNQSRWSVGRFLANTNISDIQVLAWGGGNFAAGNYVLYGVK